MDFLKKTCAVCMVGLGTGILLTLLLPLSGWIFGIGAVLLILGLAWLCK